MKNLLNVDPVKGFIISITSFVAGVTPDAAMAAEPVIHQSAVQCSIVFYFQITAFTVTIVAGLFSAYLSYKKLTKK